MLTKRMTMMFLDACSILLKFEDHLKKQWIMLMVIVTTFPKLKQALHLQSSSHVNIS